MADDYKYHPHLGESHIINDRNVSPIEQGKIDRARNGGWNTPQQSDESTEAFLRRKNGF